MSRWPASGVALIVVGMVVAGVRVAGAATNPIGIQNDVPYSTDVNDWGWNVAYRGHYSETVLLADVLKNATGDYVMLAAIQAGSPTFDVLAAARKADVLTYTAWNATHVANGAQWYFNGYSVGFAGLEDTIFQSGADVNGLEERDRLSWHTATYYNPSSGTFYQDVLQVPPWLLFGWRSGANTGLNQNSDWDRLVLTSNAPSVPEPASALLGGIGLVGLAVVGATRARRFKRHG